MATRKRSEVARLPNPQPEPVLIEGQVCEKCYNPVYSTPSGVLCKQCGGGVETLPMPQNPQPEPVQLPVQSTQPVQPTHTPVHEETNPVKAVFGEHYKTNALAKLDRIVVSVLNCDIDGEYERLTNSLKLRGGRGDRGIVQQSIDEAEDNARIAHQVYINAKLVKEAYESKVEPVIAGMWASARQLLEKEKTEGLRTKQITDNDVKYKVIEMYGDEYSSQQTKLRQYDQTIKHLEHIVQVWNSRCNSVRKLSDLLR